MRTPGRCTNLEGCWISASHRDVWLSIGEDFVCPNCGGNLSAPPKSAVSFRGLKQAALTGVALTMGLAAVAVAGVKIATVVRSHKPAVVALLRRPGSLLQGNVLVKHAAPVVSAAAGPPAPLQLAAPAARPVTLRTQLASVAAWRSQQPGLTAAPASHDAVHDATGATDHVAPPRSAPILLYAAAPEKPTAPREPATDQVAAGTDRIMAPALITLVSEARFVLPPISQQILVLPISFGRPLAPEDASEPVTKRWHHHGLANMRHSGFLPGPPGSDPASELPRTTALMR
jgi:hypothetical protein